MPCNYADYPPNWKTEIRPRIIERDGHRCRFCLVPNGAWRYTNSEQWHFAITREMVNAFRADGASKIVLTIAHLNHDLSDNRDCNLAALCQRCHNRLDAPHQTRKHSGLTKGVGVVR